MTIIDVSTWQGVIDWPRVRAAGVTKVIVRGPIGDRWVDDRYQVNWAGAAQIPERGVYCDLILGQSGAAQAANIYHQTGANFGTEPIALDVERTPDERQACDAGWIFPKAQYTAMLKDVVDGLLPVVPVEIYTSKIEWAAMTTQPAWALGLRHWLAHYNDHLAAPDCPPGWEWYRWQYGQYPVDGINAPVDLNRERVTPAPITGAGEPMFTPVITHGPKLGLHTISHAQAIPLVHRARDAGWRWAMVKNVNSPGVSVDAKRIDPDTLTLTRFINDGHRGGDGYDALQAVDTWTAADIADFARATIENVFRRTSWAEYDATDYWGLINEPNRPGIYDAIARACLALVQEADLRTPSLVAAGHKPMKLALPALPQGCPEWAGMLQIVHSGLLQLMVAGGHIFDVHEGVMGDQPIDFGYGDLIPGAPYVPPGAGSTNFRHRYLKLAADLAGVPFPPLVISEAYYGGGYPPGQSNADIVARARWYDLRARETPYLLAVLPFTIDPDAGWLQQDYTPTFQSAELWAYIEAEKNLPNAVPGETPMDESLRQALLTDVHTGQTANSQAAAALADAERLLRAAAVHVWRAGDVALATANPLQLYDGQHTPKQVINATWDINVFAVSIDGLWLQVTQAGLWCKAADCRLKS